MEINDTTLNYVKLDRLKSTVYLASQSVFNINTHTIFPFSGFKRLGRLFSRGQQEIICFSEQKVGPGICTLFLDNHIIVLLTMNAGNGD